jgi:hypothetical protein
MLLSNDRTSLLQNSWDRYLFGSAGISVDFYVYAPTNTYRCVEEQLFCIFIPVQRIHLLRLPLYAPFLWVTASIYVDISSLAIQKISTNQIASCFQSAVSLITDKKSQEPTRSVENQIYLVYGINKDKCIKLKAYIKYFNK